MKARIFAFLFFAAIAVLPVAAQNQPLASVIHTIHRIESPNLGETRTVIVRVPAGYDRGSAKYPVVYMLDAHAPQNSMMAGIVDLESWSGMMPEMIIVGIQNTSRTRDLTPSRTREGTGGGDKFLDFIEKEVVPLVEKNYRTQPYRIFAGHSLGGLTAVYAAVSRPDLFNAFIAASPVLHWDDDFVIKRAAEAFKQNREWNKRIFISIGDEPDYVKGFSTFQDLLKRTKPKNFEAEFRQFKEENHGSNVLPSYLAGFRHIFKGWTPPTGGALSDLENHYKKLTSRFGYEVKIPEAMLNQIGYQLLAANRIDEALAAFRKNAENYPESPNVFDSLGEAYEKNNQLKQAAASYEKAWKLAEEKGDKDLAAISKANYERVSKKLQ